MVTLPPSACQVLRESGGSTPASEIASQLPHRCLRECIEGVEPSTDLERLPWPLHALLEAHQNSIKATLEDMYRHATAQASMHFDQFQQQLLGSIGQTRRDHPNGPGEAASTWPGLSCAAEAEGRSAQGSASLFNFLPPMAFARWEDPCTEIARAVAKELQSHEKRLEVLQQAHANCLENLLKRHLEPEEGALKLHRCVEDRCGRYSLLLEEVLANVRQAGGGHGVSRLQTGPVCEAADVPMACPVPEAPAELPRSALQQAEDFGSLEKGLPPASAAPPVCAEGCRPPAGEALERNGESTAKAGGGALQAEPERKEEDATAAAAVAVARRAAQLRGRRTGMLNRFSGLLIFVNIIFMAVEVEVGMASAVRGEDASPWVWWVGLAFAVLFSVELAARFALERWKFLLGPNRRWNVFDLTLLVLQWFDVTVSFINLSFFRSLRGLRAIRAVRIIRSVRFIRELRVMVAAISCSMMSLLWALLFLVIILFMGALAVQQTVQAHIEQQGAAGVAFLPKDLIHYYGSLPTAMISLFKAISGGADWQDLVEPLEAISQVYLYAFVAFMCVLLLGVMNILTAIFVDSTCKIADVDHDLVIQECLEHEETTTKQLREFLTSTDNDHSGTVSKAEFDAKLVDPNFRAQLKLLELDIHEAKGLFDLTDVNQTGDVEIEELVCGLMRLKGGAKAVDMATLLHENSRVLVKLNAFMKSMEDNFEHIRSTLGTDTPPELGVSSPTANFMHQRDLALAQSPAASFRPERRRPLTGRGGSRGLAQKLTPAHAVTVLYN